MRTRAPRAPVKKRPWRIAKKIAKRGGWMQCRGPYTTSLVEILREMYPVPRMLDLERRLFPELHPDPHEVHRP